MKSSVPHSEASELPCVPVRIPAALYCSRYQSELQKLFIEEPCVSAQIPNQVAYFCTDPRVLVKNKNFEVVVDRGLMDVLIEVFRDSRKLRDQAQSVNNECCLVLFCQKFVLRDVSQAATRDKLLGEGL
jgi:hypothetical protein